MGLLFELETMDPFISAFKTLLSCCSLWKYTQKTVSMLKKIRLQAAKDVSQQVELGWRQSTYQNGPTLRAWDTGTVCDWDRDTVEMFLSVGVHSFYDQKTVAKSDRFLRIFATGEAAHHVWHLSTTNIDPPDQLECFLEPEMSDTVVKLVTFCFKTVQNVYISPFKPLLSLWVSGPLMQRVAHRKLWLLWIGHFIGSVRRWCKAGAIRLSRFNFLPFRWLQDDIMVLYLFGFWSFGAIHGLFESLW